MTNKICSFLFSLIIFSSFNIAKNTPTSVNPLSQSSLTGLWYNSEKGLPIQQYSGIDESKIASSKYNANNIFDYSNWNLDVLFPDRQRDLAYKYYSDIPGVVWIEKNFFIDETEVTNIYWQEYLYFSGKKWNIENTSTILPVDYYSNPKYRFFPVVGISYDQALEFCKWRTAFITKEYNESKGYKISDLEYTIFRFDLPTEAQWVKCAGYGLDIKKYPYGFNTLTIPTKFSKDASSYFAGLTLNDLTETDLKKQVSHFNKTIKSDYILNCKREVSSFLNLKTPFHVWSKPPNHFGIYNMLGNASELVKEKGIIKGGSWLDSIENCKIESKELQNNLSEKVGFRCICVLEWPNQKTKI